MRVYVFDDNRLGVLVGGDRLADVTPLVGDGDPMIALITAWEDLRESVAAAAAGPGDVGLADVTIRAPLARPGKIIAAPVNYSRHREEMGGEGGVYEGATIRTIETYAGFVKASSSIVGPEEPILLPPGDRRVDHEAEVGFVIGRRASCVSRDSALQYVFGYVPLLDITIRGEEDRSFRKSFDTFTPIGPAIVTADEVEDPGAIDFELTVNGERRQHASTRDLIFDVPRLVELYSAAMTLEPGDVIASGTPEGVGPIEAGDRVVLTIPALGELAMEVAARAPSQSGGRSAAAGLGPSR